jgi:hypothetical protein
VTRSDPVHCGRQLQYGGRHKGGAHREEYMDRRTVLDIGISRDGVLHRRHFLRTAGLGLAAASWLDCLGLHADDLKKRNAACILIWLGGGPSQFETWDPKPGTSNGGETKSISTAVPGIKIAEYWPKVAEMMRDCAIIRTMTSKEGNHERATYQLHTGRAPTGALKFPNIGSVVAQELGESTAELPNFVSVGETIGPGFLGIQAAPFVVNSPGELPANVATTVSKERLARRLELVGAQNAELGKAGAGEIAASQQGLIDQAARMVLSPKLKTFDLKTESDQMRDAFGRNAFGQGLLMARRLVEATVPFIEVRRGGWDNHNDLWKNISRQAKDVDLGIAQLLRDLKTRGLLDTTLVVCMGEFGRTPKVNNKGGRDHYPKAFSILLAGSGIRGGRVVGKTKDDGTEVTDRPVSVPDLFQTFCRALKLNPATEMVTPQGRPVKIVDEGKPVNELFT